MKKTDKNDKGLTQVKKMKLSDYEVGRTLGRGTSKSMKVVLELLRSPRTSKTGSMLH